MSKQFVLINGVATEVEVMTKSQVADLERKPKVLEALTALTKKTELSNWLFDMKTSIEEAFGAGTVKRVTKQERKQLKAALDHIAEVMGDDKKAAFVVQHRDDIAEVFKWPTQQRVKPEEKEGAIREALLELSEGNESVTDWIISNKDALFVAYDTGRVKREVPESTKAALAAHRAAQAAKKAAAEAA